MIMDITKFGAESGEDFIKKQNRELYDQLVTIGIEKDLEAVEELFDPNVIGEKIKDEMQRVGNRWSHAFTTRANCLSGSIGIILMVIEGIDVNLRNSSFGALKDVLLRNQRQINEIVDSARSSEDVDEEQRKSLVKKLSSQAFQFQMDINNVLNQLLQG